MIDATRAFVVGVLEEWATDAICPAVTGATATTTAAPDRACGRTNLADREIR
jgi:hypothetical protein